MKPLRLAYLAVFPMFLGLAGCSSKSAPTSKADLEGDAGGGSDAQAAHCETRGPECLKTQQICVVDGGKELCQSCGEGEYAADANTCASIPGEALHHDFGTYSLKPAEELDGVCQSWTLNNEDELWVNGVELVTNGGYHHSNWLFAPDDQYVGDDGAWPCKDRGYSELTAAIAGGVLFAQSTQAKHQVQKFPEGVAVRLPPHARVIGGVHLLNTGEDPFDTTLQLSIFSIPTSDVKIPLAPFRLSYLDLTIPPKAVSEFSGQCDMSAAIQGGTPGDLDMDLYYVMPHYHSLGHSFLLQTFGGDDDGKTIFEVGAFDGEAHGMPIDPPLSMRGSKGFRFTCGFENPRDVEVGWGIGDQEMCVMLGFARSDYAFDASVLTGGANGKNGTTFEYTGECGVLPLEFGRGKGDLPPAP